MEKEYIQQAGLVSQNIMEGAGERIKRILSRLGKIKVSFHKHHSSIGYSSGEKSDYVWFCEMGFYLKTGLFSKKQLMVLSTRFDIDTKEPGMIRTPAYFAVIHLPEFDVPIEVIKEVIKELEYKNKREFGKIKIQTHNREIREALHAYV